LDWLGYDLRLTRLRTHTRTHTHTLDSWLIVLVQLTLLVVVLFFSWILILIRLVGLVIPLVGSFEKKKYRLFLRFWLVGFWQFLYSQFMVYSSVIFLTSRVRLGSGCGSTVRSTTVNFAQLGSTGLFWFARSCCYGCCSPVLVG